MGCRCGHSLRESEVWKYTLSCISHLASIKHVAVNALLNWGEDEITVSTKQCDTEYNRCNALYTLTCLRWSVVTTGLLAQGESGGGHSLRLVPSAWQIAWEAPDEEPTFVLPRRWVLSTEGVTLLNIHNSAYIGDKGGNTW